MTVPVLQDVIEAIQDVVGVITGVEIAPDYPPDNIAVWPSIVTYANGGYARTGEFGIAEYFHNIVCEVHYPRKDLENDVKITMPYVEDIIEAITDDPWLSNNCETFDRISYTFGAMQYAEQLTVGFRFVIENLKMFPYGKQ